MNDQTELTLTETNITEWIDANLSAPSMLKAQAATTDRACCKALFLGTDDSDPNASGEAIFSRKNLPIAVATILKFLQKRSDFYPNTQNAKIIPYTLHQFYNQLNNTPFLRLMENNSIQKNFSNKNYPKIMDDFMTLFSDYSNEDKTKIRNAAREAIQTQSFDAGTNTYQNTFYLLLIRNKNNQSADICIYSVSFDMEINANQPQIKGNQDYNFSYAIYNLSSTMLDGMARPMSFLPKSSVNEWITGNSSPKNAAINLCF